MSLSCKNVEDYVTLYKDGVLSGETCAEVEEHLSECKECKRFYKEYDGMNTSVPKLCEVKGEDADFAAVAEKIRRKKTAASLISAAGMLAIIAGTAYLTHLLFPKDDK